MPTQIQARQLKAIAEADAVLDKLELKQIERTNNALEKALADLIKQLRGKLSDDRTPNLFAQQRAILIANDLRDTLNVFSPDNPRTMALLEDFKQLTIEADRVGSGLAETLVEHYEPSIASTADLSLDVVAAVAQAGYDRLLTRGSTFADNANTAIQQGLLQGWGVNKITSAVRAIGGVTRAEAERIVRTESNRAAISAVKNRYQSEGIDQVIWIATQDRRTCPRCAARAGGIYQMDKVTLPLHPNDRCYLSPFKKAWADAGLIDFEWMENHHSKSIKLAGKADNSASPWELNGTPKQIKYEI
jgi:SPP1 gp7 family putative phage head morphogenesis protein